MAQTAEILEALPPAQEQPAGLALLDLNVTATPLIITWDKDAVSTLLDTILAQYAGLEVQEADVPAIKNEMAGLNKLRERWTTPGRTSSGGLPGRWTGSTPRSRR